MPRRYLLTPVICTFLVVSIMSAVAWERLDTSEISQSIPGLKLDTYELQAPAAETDDERSEFLELTDAEFKRLRQLLTAKTVPVPTPEGEELTPREYKRLKQMVNTEKATAREVADVNLAVKGPNLVMGLLVGLLFLVTFRYTFKRWFSPIVSSEAWPSVVVICAMLAFMAAVLYAAVS
jgi:uncharacterized membrane protein